MTTGAPTWRYERAMWRAGHGRVAGVDEVGRGPLAGPVVAGAVVLPRSRAAWIDRLRDSKVLTARAREELATAIRRHADWGIGIVSPHVIDQIGIVLATHLAMRIAVRELRQPPDALIVDGREVVSAGIPEQAIIDGDALCVSIAAASIVAKVARDALMRELEPLFPGYGFARNMGYATGEHREALTRLGPCTQHRQAWAPVRAAAYAHRSLDRSTRGPDAI